MTIIPPWAKLAAMAAAVAAIGLGGIKLGMWYVHTQWDKDKLQRAQAEQQYIARNLVSRKLAEEAVQATETKLTNALRKAQNAPRTTIACPASGDVRDAVLDGLGDRLRAIHSAGDTAPANVAPVQPAAPNK